MQQHVDYESRTDPGYRRASRRPLIVLACVFFAINVALLTLASGGGRGGIFVAMMLGPATNILAALVAMTFTRTVRRAYGSEARTSYLSVAIGLPVAAIVGDFAIILAMGWTGC